MASEPFEAEKTRYRNARHSVPKWLRPRLDEAVAGLRRVPHGRNQSHAYQGRPGGTCKLDETRQKQRQL